MFRRLRSLAYRLLIPTPVLGPRVAAWHDTRRALESIASPQAVLEALEEPLAPMWPLRIETVLECPDNAHVPRVADAGALDGGALVMHNGVRVLALSYYGAGGLRLMMANRGAHEPQEERAFGAVVEALPPRAVMLELGSYWGFYAIWFLGAVRGGRALLVEPDAVRLAVGRRNFDLNRRRGKFTRAYVGSEEGAAGDGVPITTVDRMLAEHRLSHLHVLHADIQGAELDMLSGAARSLANHAISYLFVSTHSIELHTRCIERLEALGYRILCSADLNESYSYDGLVVACSPRHSALESLDISHRPGVGATVDQFLYAASGVVHVGANTGQERYHYRDHGLRVLWVEPTPEVFAELLDNIVDMSDQRAVQALVAEEDGEEHPFHLASNAGNSSSMLDLKAHRDVWPDVTYTDTISLKSITLATLLDREQIEPREYDTLVVDTQGSELRVLLGAVPVLERFRYIKIEVADFEAYEGCCQLADVGAFMAEHGYGEVARRSFARHPSGGRYFDVLYRNGEHGHDRAPGATRAAR